MVNPMVNQGFGESGMNRQRWIKYSLIKNYMKCQLTSRAKSG